MESEQRHCCFNPNHKSIFTDKEQEVLNKLREAGELFDELWVSYNESIPQDPKRRMKIIQQVLSTMAIMRFYFYKQKQK